jgi:tetratricopeptide (TPR) repeat protein
VAVILEERVPYHESVLWQIHDAYFARRGAAAWRAREIPNFPTTNSVVARQHARFLVETVAALEEEGALERGGPVHVLEVGAGTGDFAKNFFRALETSCGDPGRALVARLKYVLSDYSAKNVAEALAQRALGARVAQGSLVGATFDLAGSRALLDLEGRPIEARFAALVANYVCCVSRPSLVRKSGGAFHEGRVSVRAPRPLAALLEDPTSAELMKNLETRVDWQPVELAPLLGDDHAAAIADTVEPFETATVVYPRAFLEFVRAMRPRMLAGGVALVTDYGAGRRSELAGEEEPKPGHYGNTLNHPVAFPVVEAFAQRAELSVLRMRGAFSPLYTAAILYTPERSPRLARAFARIYLREGRGTELLNLRAAAVALATLKDCRGAAALFERCLELDPNSVDLHHRLGAVCLDGGWDRLSLRHLKRGKALDDADAYDFDFLLGRAYVKLRRWAPARRAFERSLERAPSSEGHRYLGIALEHLDDFRGAYLAFRKALDLDPQSETARGLMLHVIEDYLPKAFAVGVVEGIP